ncbi:MAG TPA: hypothetical protein VE130_14045, partial [Nitrososphaeraceae archaeon]|nr:hypothetical protein [Nitrososphaeraceae archaeon]
ARELSTPVIFSSVLSSSSLTNCCTNSSLSLDLDYLQMTMTDPSSSICELHFFKGWDILYLLLAQLSVD